MATKKYNRYWAYPETVQAVMPLLSDRGVVDELARLIEKGEGYHQGFFQKHDLSPEVYRVIERGNPPWMADMPDLLFDELEMARLQLEGEDRARISVFSRRAGRKYYHRVCSGSSELDWKAIIQYSTKRCMSKRDCQDLMLLLMDNSFVDSLSRYFFELEDFSSLIQGSSLSVQSSVWKGFEAIDSGQPPGEEIRELFTSRNVYSLSWDSGAPGPGAWCDGVSLIGGLYYVDLEPEVYGPFYRFEDALQNTEILSVTTATTDVDCSMLSERQITQWLRPFDLPYGFSLCINGTPWTWVPDGRWKRDRSGRLAERFSESGEGLWCSNVIRIRLVGDPCSSFSRSSSLVVHQVPRLCNPQWIKPSSELPRLILDWG